MSATEIPPPTIADTITYSDPIRQGVARFLVDRKLGGLELVDGHLLDITAVVEDDAYIAVDITRWNFDGEDTTVRVLLHITAPMTSEYADEDEPVAGVGEMDQSSGDAA